MAESKSAILPTLVVASPFCLLLGFVFLLSKNMAGAIIFLMAGISTGAVAGTKLAASPKAQPAAADEEQAL